DRSRWHSNFTPALQSAGERHLIGVLQVAAHGKALRDAGDAHAERLHQTSDVQRRRLAFDGRIGCHDHFLDAVVQARDQLLQHVERQPLRRLLSDARQLREQHGEAGNRIDHFGKPGIIPPSDESGFSAAAASCAALSAEFTAANTKSSSMGTSRGSTACLSICTFWISPLPLALTITIPPPLEPVTVLRANRSCASRICSWSCCACSKSAFKSNPGMPYSSPRSRTSSISPPRTSTAARTAGCSRASAIRLSDAAARS